LKGSLAGFIGGSISSKSADVKSFPQVLCAATWFQS